ncbi:MAG: Crp/Fnr family transcriptional regulator [Anaerotignaceae bacterium]
MKYIKLIKQTFIGCQLTDDEIKMALNNYNFKIRHFHNGEVLHTEDEKCINLEILLIGSIENMQIDQFDNERIIKTFEPNEIIAGNILFGSFPKYPLSFLAQSEGTLLQVDKNFLFELFLKKPNILRQFLIQISDRAISLGSKIKLAERKSLRENIMDYLHSQSLLQNSKTFNLPISKTELANRLGVQRTSVSREFSRMEKDGLIKLYDDNRTIEIVK